jgi:hypothetical protein
MGLRIDNQPPIYLCSGWPRRQRKAGGRCTGCHNATEEFPT